MLNIVLMRSAFCRVVPHTYPRKFGNHVTAHRATVRRHHRHTNKKQLNQFNRYGNSNATEENRMAARTFREKKNNNNKVVSFSTFFS